MAAGLNVADFVRVSVSLQPAAALYRGFGNGLVVGSTPGVIDVAERLRLYTSLDGVAQDFGTTAPETLAATLHFSQDPQPAQLYIGRWAQSATAGNLHGAVLTPSQQLLSNFTAISNGSLRISVDGTQRDLTGLNFSGALNLNGVAQILQTALAAVATGATVKWDSVQKRFTVTSGTTGPTSSVSYGSTVSPASGTDVSTLFHFTNADASAPVIGQTAESLVSAVAALADKSGDWYSLQVATATPPADADHIAAATFIEGLSTTQSRIYGLTIQNTNALDSTTSADLGSQLQTLNLARTYYQFSGNNPYAAQSLFGRASTVDFSGSNTTITLAYKREPGVVAENITESQFATLQRKNYNVFTNVNNGTAIVFAGKMANGDHFDERHGADWLQNRIQTDVYNLLYLSPTKIPQTDAGMNQIKAVITAACQVAVANGFVAGNRVWTGPSIGALKTGMTLTSGFYVFAPAVSTQSDADRYARKSVPFQVCLTLAGAVHLITISALLNR